MEDKKQTPEEAFKESIRELIIEWYGNCPHAMKFTSSVIKEFKKTFPDDDFMKEIDRNL